MIDNIMPSLVELGTENIVQIVEEVLENGTEADQQIDFFRKNGMEGLLSFLMDEVEYEYRGNL